MLRTRLWMGAVLVALAVGVLVVDPRLATPWYPFLFVVVLGLALAACYELIQLLGTERRLPAWYCYAAIAALVLANWLPHVIDASVDVGQRGAVNPWTCIASVFALAMLGAYLVEMATFREPGSSVMRVALVVWIAGYLGLLPSFLAQLRWLEHGSVALALTIFVPKCGDSGAYFTGRLIGRHHMAPVLSPKKTWEGAAGAIVAAVLAAVGIDQAGPALRGGLWAEIGFGVTVGVAGLLGDLAESLIKRDCRRKDASQIMPGFGGVLDVVDSVVFAAPVAYLWLQRQ
jgi:phosphatidate cytidylyltransferase